MHRAAPVPREPVAVRPHDVDIAGTRRNADFENSRALDNQRENAALDNLAIVDLALFEVEN